MYVVQISVFSYDLFSMTWANGILWPEEKQMIIYFLV